jgi:hypothetical protein
MRMGISRTATTALTVLVFSVAVFGLAGCTPARTSSPSAGGTVQPRETPVPAPGGDITQTVAPVDPGATTKVSLVQPALLSSKVTISIVSAKRQHVEATTPGEISGPAIVVTVRVTNGTTAALDLGSTVVSLVDAAGNLGQPTTAGAANPFTDTIAPGKSLDGVYVFGIPISGTNPIQISVSYAGGGPVAVFAGDVE